VLRKPDISPNKPLNCRIRGFRIALNCKRLLLQLHDQIRLGPRERIPRC